MKRRTLFGWLLAMLLSTTPALAENTLTAAEISNLLAGNTISGDWNGMYKQFFAENGATTYTPEGGPPAPGKWRVNAVENTYESWWENTGWAGYQIAHDGDAYVWLDSSGNKFPFIVMAGNRMK